MPTRRRALLILAALAGLSQLSIVLALMVGSIAIGPLDVLATLLDGNGGVAGEVVRSLRLPRALTGFACGGLLALAGALLQVLLRNPLADPYVLGISGGAGIGALLAIVLGLGVAGVNGLAFAGALGAMLLVFGLAHGEGGWTHSRLLLTGVIVAAGCGAVVTLMLAMAPDDRLRGMLFWLMGDLSQTGDPQLVLILLATVLLVSLPFARELNLLARGADVAQALGVAVRPLRRGVYLVASLATAAAVTHAGAIGFIGLIVPHLVRLATGNDQRLLLPASVLAGGSLLVIADTLARTILAPQQLPVGVLTALIGVPVFLFLLTRGAAGRG
ncbi:MAG: Hemin transport system permease protein HmuU [Candidatus Accumulibacter regalis]|uniref:Hemin transport system permease protein HmuU n=2 Tax=Candidatus Accumulibacter TaxID=327159 RepID=A0A011QHP4_ACCRE|nr:MULTISPECIES: iron ABC transporter permease [unclassified Candidatus Accumulibacter]EXI88540.1 MAG: Hemin transport system permease protein HmuU [Candidatus Accumulibacter regalis]MQM32890.1 iron ABC transporter permease [Candidatus Accumulibacter phosphatis]MBL8369171.1 iron ABC transporter permease [Accumulibacter sp.]MBN8514923.1 iron ABC transporter permease [Accumulibacter sp.]HRE71929.1 iron ABC transporter permease [Accumulibacter sp.]